MLEELDRGTPHRAILKGSAEFFRVEFAGIGHADGNQQLRFKECQSDVDTLMKTPEYIAAEEKYIANNPTTEKMDQDENGKYYMKEVPAKFRPRFYSIDNSWISNPNKRGKGHGKELYKAFIEQAAEYSKSYGGVFIGAHECSGGGTSEDAKRVWKSLGRDYNSSGEVIFIGL